MSILNREIGPSADDPWYEHVIFLLLVVLFFVLVCVSMKDAKQRDELNADVSSPSRPAGIPVREVK